MELNTNPPKRRFPLWTSVVVILLLTAIAYPAVNYFRTQTFLKQGKNYYEQGELKKAEESFKTSIKYYSKNPLPYAYLGMIISPDFPEPVRAGSINLRVVLSGGNPNDYGALYRESINYHEKALSLGLTKEKFPDYVPALHDLATAYRLWGEDDKAIEKYLEEIRLNPDSSFWARYWVAQDYYGRQNKPKEALDMMTSALNAKDADVNQLYRAYSSLSNYYRYFEDDPNAEKYARLALQSAPQNPEEQGEKQEVEYIHTLLAELAGRRGNIVLAESEIKKANELAGKELYNCELAKIYYENDFFDKAIAEAGKTANLGPRNRPCVWVLGMANFKKGDKEEAEKYFDAFLRLAEESKVKTANFFRQIEEVKNALQEL